MISCFLLLSYTQSKALAHRENLLTVNPIHTGLINKIDTVPQIENDTFPATQTFTKSDSLVTADTTSPSPATTVLLLTGKITDETGAPLGGANIEIKGKGKGTSSHTDGSFSITAESDDVLVISFVGYNDRTVQVNGRSYISVGLQPSRKESNEVVVVGYGTQRKIDVTGAVGSVKGAELYKQPVLTATQALQGKVAGVQIIDNAQPGTNPTVRIRGIGTMLSGSDPLYVVDGIITTDITNINTADILSVDVLKDASSTAIYGARGANGVIIITTRQGSGKMRVNYNANIGVVSAAHLVKMASGQQYANYVSASTFGITSPAQIMAQAGSPAGTSTNWYNEILRNAIQERHNLSLSGSNENNKYLLSFGYEDDQGIVITNDYKRISVRMNDEFKLSDKFKIGTVAGYTNANDRQANVATAFNDAYRASPLIPAMVNGKYGNVSNFQSVVGNPILDINDNNHTFIHNRVEGAAYIEFKPVKYITFRSNLGADLEYIDEKLYNYQFRADTTTFNVSGGSQQNSISNLNVVSTKNLHWVWDNTITFNKTFHKHSLTVLAGTTAEEYTTGFFSAYRQNVPPDPDLWFINVGDINTSQNNSQQTKATRVSYLGRVNYSYNQKYLFTGTIRADASSVFPSYERWGYFPSAGAGWIITKERFMQDQKTFDLLKLKGSWGKAGNDNIPGNSFTPTLLNNLNYPFGSPLSQSNGVAIAQLKDQNLKWETTTESDISVEFATLKNRLTGEIGYYNKTTKDALIYTLISATSGSQPDFSVGSPAPAGSVLTNAASIKNAGVEVALGWNDKITTNLSYHINGNISFNKNEVIGLNGGQPLLDGRINNDLVTKTDNGEAIGSFYVRKAIGVFQSQAEIDSYVDSHGNKLQGTANPGDLKYSFTNGNVDFVYAGSYQPKAFYGINIGVNFKAFDFSIDGYGENGNKVYNGKRQNRINEYDNVEASVAANAWPNTTSQPGPNQGNQPSSTYFVENGSFFRINNATIGYTLPADAIKGLKKVISSFRAFITGQNILTITKYSGFTPEIGGTPTNSGIETGTYPTSKTFAVGINVGFE
ncbi:MAG TPA: TonB-dependent receptor [Ferruginibacter sp.]|nr:TonB-dependent receptor [Ferruginibacter sp.]